jgi:hypothetical protein
MELEFRTTTQLTWLLKKKTYHLWAFFQNSNLFFYTTQLTDFAR